MNNAINFVKVTLRKRSLSHHALLLFCMLSFVLGTAYWAGAFSSSTHELELWVNAQGAPQMKLIRSSDGVPILDYDLHYPDARCGWAVEIEATNARNPQSWGSEIWIQNIRSDEGDLKWDDVAIEGDWERKPSEDAASGTALVSYGRGEPCKIKAVLHGSEISIRYSRHQWTGIMNITANGQTRIIDTWRNNFAPGTTHFCAPPSPSDRIDDHYISLFVSPNDIGHSASLLAAVSKGSLSVSRARFDGHSLKISKGAQISIPSRFRLVWLPALGMGLISSMAVPILFALLYAPIRKHPFWSFVIAVSLLKLWMIGGDEMRGSLYDGRGYMLSSVQGFWSEAFSQHGYERQPVYPLFISLCRAFGLPLRIGLELLWLSACLLVASSLPRLKLPRWSAGAAYALMALNPITFPALSFGYQDVAYAPMLLLMIGAMLHAVSPWKWRTYACAGTGLFAALLWNSRPEHILVVGMLAVFAVTLLLVDYMAQWKQEQAVRVAMKAVAPAIVLTLAITLTLAGIARTTPMGAFATSNFQMKGFTALYDELLAIQPEHTEPYHPVPTDARMKAYQASPTMKTMQWALEGPALETYTTLAGKGGDVRTDYGVFFFWGLRQAPWHMKQWQSAAQLDRFYAQCAAELKAARKRGDYKSRHVFAHYIEPDSSVWLPYLGEGVSRYVKMLTRTDIETLSPEGEGVESWIFDSAALRRTALVKNNGAMWSASSPETIKAAKHVCAIMNAVATWTAAILFLPALIYYLMRLRKKADPETTYAIALLVIVTAAFVSRFLLISVMHAVAFEAESRYILPIAPLPALLCVVFAATAWKALGEPRRKRQ